MKNKPFPNLDGREDKTKKLRASAIEILGGESEYDSASYMIRSLACRAATLDWIIENERLEPSALVQANNAYLGICRKLQSDNKEYAPRISKEDFLKAVSEGVHSAIWDVATNATDMPCADFYDAISSGVQAATEGADNG